MRITPIMLLRTHIERKNSAIARKNKKSRPAVLQPSLRPVVPACPSCYREPWTSRKTRLAALVARNRPGRIPTIPSLRPAQCLCASVANPFLFGFCIILVQI